MSRFKFRAWDKVTQKMFATGFHLIGEVMAFGVIEEYLAENPAGKTILERMGDVEIMQWTGLQDKNGKDIYEGDVIQDSEGSRAPVIWEEDNCQFLASFSDGCGLQVLGDWAVVIGNIYENPELLKV